VETQVGDARLLLEQELAQGRAQKFDVLVLDAFSGDAIPSHLLTKEAFETYKKHLRDENSVIALHLSSHHINLLPVVEGIRDYLHYSLVVHYSQPEYPFSESLWAFLARDSRGLAVPDLTERRPRHLPAVSPRLWTDDHSDIFRLIY
jgi:spermidine synthase